MRAPLGLSPFMTRAQARARPQRVRLPTAGEAVQDAAQRERNIHAWTGEAHAGGRVDRRGPRGATRPDTGGRLTVSQTSATRCGAVASEAVG
jgi:hypothetical protein